MFKMIVTAIIISNHRELRIRPHKCSKGNSECSKEDRLISRCIIFFGFQLHEQFFYNHLRCIHYDHYSDYYF